MRIVVLGCTAHALRASNLYVRLCPQVRKRDVDAYSMPSDGVWHPDSLPLSMAYSGTSSSADGAAGQLGWFDPFASPVQRKLIAEAFTERLPAPFARTLQWALPQHGRKSTAPARSNLAIAHQDSRPDWLTKGGACVRASL